MKSTFKKPAKMIVTRRGHIFVNLHGFFFYMSKNGTRHFSQGELKKGKLPNSKEWDWAQTTWEEKPENMTPQMEGLAAKLAEKIKSNPFYGASREELLELEGAKKLQQSKNNSFVNNAAQRASVTRTDNRATNNLSDFLRK